MSAGRTTLRVVTMPATPANRCDGTYVCPCERCNLERAQAVARGVRARPRPVPLKHAA